MEKIITNLSLLIWINRVLYSTLEVTNRSKTRPIRVKKQCLKLKERPLWDLIFLYKMTVVYDKRLFYYP